MRVLFKTNCPNPFQVIEIVDIGIYDDTNNLWFYTTNKEIYATAKELPNTIKANSDLYSLLQLGFLDLTDPYYGFFVLLKGELDENHGED